MLLCIGHISVDLTPSRAHLFLTLVSEQGGGRCTSTLVSKLLSIVWNWKLYERYSFCLVKKWQLVTSLTGSGDCYVICRIKINFWWLYQKFKMTSSIFFCQGEDLIMSLTRICFEMLNNWSEKSEYISKWVICSFAEVTEGCDF